MEKMIATVCLALLLSVVYAQEDSLETEQIEIIKEFRPFLEEGNKQQFSPKMPDIVPNNREQLEFIVEPKFLAIDYKPDGLEPLPLELPVIDDSKHIYLKAGYGNRSNPLAQLAISGSEKNNYSVGVLGSHQGIKGKDLEYQQMSESRIKLFGNKEINESMLLKANGTFYQQKNWLYGFNQELFSLDENLISQRINQFGANIGAESMPSDSPFSYDISTRFNLLSSNLFDLSETQLGFLGSAKYNMQSQWIPKISLQVDQRNSDIPQSIEAKSDRLVLHALPSVVYQSDVFEVEAGVSVNNDEDHDFALFPHIDARLPLLDGKYNLFAGWTGATKINGLQQISAVNPRVSGNIRLQNYTHQIRQLGIQGYLSDEVNFRVAMQQQVQENIPLFSLESASSIPTDGSQFTLLYEKELITYSPVVELGYQADKISGDFSFQYNGYNTTTNASAWHMPKVNTELQFSYRPLQKLLIDTDFSYLGGIEVLDISNTATTLDGILGLHVGAEYQITEQIGVFINGNNLANQTNARWVNYPLVGLSILGGVTATF